MSGSPKPKTKARGRLDRYWESGYGGLWFSLLMRSGHAGFPCVPPITLLAGLSLRKAVQDVAGLDLKVKWPNDLVVRSRGVWKKCAGILTEMSGHNGPHAEWLGPSEIRAEREQFHPARFIQKRGVFVQPPGENRFTSGFLRRFLKLFL